MSEVIGVGVLLLLIVGGGYAFAYPWVPTPPLGGVQLAKYVPLADGDARLLTRTSESGVTWESQNFVQVSVLRLYIDLRKALADNVLKFYPTEGNGPERQSNALVYEVRTRSMAPSGEITSRFDVIVREPRGEFLVAIYYATEGQEILFDPPLQTLPDQLDVGHEWQSEGKAGLAQYRWVGRVVEKGPFSGKLGAFDDCVRIDGELTIVGVAGPTLNPSYEWYCAEVGLVETASLSLSGERENLTEILSSTRATATDAIAPPTQALEPDTADPDPTAWQITRLGRSRQTSDSSESTIPPTWVPGDPPLVLAAGYDGDLVAFDALEDTGTIVWRFHPDGTVYGPPGVDLERGQIYFGATDKRVYALDTRGFYRWSFQTSDNVAARPITAGDLVIVGSEDWTIYGLNAATGAEVWRQSLGSSTVSAPALQSDTIIFGSDEGLVYGLDPATGDVRWTFPAQGAVEAPIMADSEWIYVADRSGTVAAIDPASCGEECEPVWSASVGTLFRTGPALVDDRLFIVDHSGELIALDRLSGEKLWASRAHTHVGQPAVAGESIIVATATGGLLQLDFDGGEQEFWDLRETSLVTDGVTTVSHGPVAGGGSIWIADNQATLRRLGPPPSLAGQSRLALSWMKRMIDAPFQRLDFKHTALDYGGAAIILDTRGNIYALEPRTGEGRLVGALPEPGTLTGVEPVLVGDTLLAVAGGNLVAVDLRTGREQWRRSGGASVRPPTVSGSIAFWLHTTEGITDEALVGAMAITAVNVTDGALLWRRPAEGLLGAGGAEVLGDTVYLSTPPMALDLATGEVRWRGLLFDPPVGGPAVDEATQTHFVGVLDLARGAGALVALDATTGIERWRAALPDDVLRVTDKPWLANGVVIVPGLTGQIMAFDAASGQELWQFKPPSETLGSISVIDDLIWLMLEDSHVLALRVEDGSVAASFGGLQLNLNAQGLSQRPQRVGSNVIIPAGSVVVSFEAPDSAP